MKLVHAGSLWLVEVAGAGGATLGTVRSAAPNTQAAVEGLSHIMELPTHAHVFKSVWRG